MHLCWSARRVDAVAPVGFEGMAAPASFLITSPGQGRWFQAQCLKDAASSNNNRECAAGPDCNRLFPGACVAELGDETLAQGVQRQCGRTPQP